MPSHRVLAVNTAADSDNKIHDDSVAAVYGFRGGLVPGVTVYGYLALPVLEHFGERWLERGSMDVRFREPLYDGEDVEVDRELENGHLEVSAGGGRATGLAWMDDSPPVRPNDYPRGPMPLEAERSPVSHETMTPGAVLGTLTTRLDLSTARMSAPLPAALGERRAAQPAILLALANEILARNVILGPWIHVASRITNFSAAVDGDALEVRGRVVEAFERKGHEFVVLDLLTSSEAGIVQRVLHTAIWRPRPALPLP